MVVIFERSKLAGGGVYRKRASAVCIYSEKTAYVEIWLLFLGFWRLKKGVESRL